MLVPSGLTRSNEAATRETCRGHNEPRRRAKALHTPPYSSSRKTQAHSDRNNFARRNGPCRRWWWQTDASASSTPCASQLHPEPHRARLPAHAETPRPKSSDRPRAWLLTPGAAALGAWLHPDMPAAAIRPGRCQVGLDCARPLAEQQALAAGASARPGGGGASAGRSVSRCRSKERRPRCPSAGQSGLCDDLHARGL
jgi:hypothetical protein